MNVERAAWKERLGLTRGTTVHLCDADLNQLSHCKSDEARRILVSVLCGKKPTTRHMSMHFRRIRKKIATRHIPPQFRRAIRKKIATPQQLNQIALNWHRYGADTLAPLLGVSRTVVHRWACEAGLPRKTGARRGVPILRVRGMEKRPVATVSVERMMELVEGMCIGETYSLEARSQIVAQG